MEKSEIQETVNAENTISDNHEPEQYFDQAEPVGLQMVDIENAAKIIGAVMERGGVFQAKELIQISSVYARLCEFLENAPKEG